jgi:hypothetical protein
VTGFSWLWIIWGVAFLAIEAVAILRKERPDQPAGGVDNIEWLISGAGLAPRPLGTKPTTTETTNG